MSPKAKTRAKSKTRKYRTRGSRRRVWLGIGAALASLLGLLWLAAGDEVEDTVRDFTLPLRHEDIIRQQANQKDVPADLIAAVIYAESRFRDQTSSAGARGLMQITPPTAEIIEDLSGGSTFEQEDLSNPDLNIRYGTFYLRHLLDKFDENEVAAIAAYNGGETNVAEWGGSDLDEDDIEFDETRAYVDTVMDKRDDYADHYEKELGL